MMKYITKITGLLSLAGLLFLYSCSADDGDYTANQGTIYMGYATVDKTSSLVGEALLVLDDGTVMQIWSYADDKASSVQKLTDHSRVYVYFFILDSKQTESSKQYMIQLNSYDEIRTKKPVYNSDSSQEAIVGSDPIGVDKSWFGGGFLNVEFHYFVGVHSITHLINLYVIENHPDADENNIYVELRHNAYEDANFYKALGSVSFDIREFLPEGKDAIMVHFTHRNFSNKLITTSEAYSRKGTVTVDISGGQSGLERATIY